MRFNSTYLRIILLTLILLVGGQDKLVGASFVGTFSNDQANGYGVYKDRREQIIYAGQWQNGKAVNHN